MVTQRTAILRPTAAFGAQTAGSVVGMTHVLSVVRGDCA